MIFFFIVVVAIGDKSVTGPVRTWQLLLGPYMVLRPHVPCKSLAAILDAWVKNNHLRHPKTYTRTTRKVFTQLWNRILHIWTYLDLVAFTDWPFTYACLGTLGYYLGVVLEITHVIDSILIIFDLCKFVFVCFLVVSSVYQRGKKSRT